MSCCIRNMSSLLFFVKLKGIFIGLLDIYPHFTLYNIHIWQRKVSCAVLCNTIFHETVSNILDHM